MTHDAPRPADLDAVAAGADLRASHEDRDRIVEILRVAARDGRLTPDELDARLEAALTARTGGELAALIPDLPAGPGPIANVPAAGPDDLARIDCRDSNTRRDGRWVVPRRMDVRVSGGSVALDFTEAVILEPSLRIDADPGGTTRRAGRC
jgi:hypothetical protein